MGEHLCTVTACIVATSLVINSVKFVKQRFVVQSSAYTGAHHAHIRPWINWCNLFQTTQLQ